ncbi:MAG: AMP-binding protein, partial [candidate division Zixibacteria bacterium]|nr:AMP-binding protein [candidate division Zixibacteria bacterium]
IAFGPTDRWLLSLPLYHVGGIGILVRGMLSGGTVVLNEIGMALSDMIHTDGITHLSVVSTQLREIVTTARQRKLAFPTLKAVLLGGGPTSPAIISEAIDLGLPLHTSYGLSEAASQVTTTAPGESALALQTSGKLLPGRELRISDDGEILIKGETLFQGYLESDSLRLPVDSLGWFHTGDLGYLDGKGDLHVTGRKDNMFISGGENIYPEEIEALLKECDGVIDAIVVPVDSEKWGKRPVAFVRFQNCTEHSQKELRDQFAAKAPKFKIPDHMFPWPVEAPTGLKIGRPYLRDLAEHMVKSLE